MKMRILSLLLAAMSIMFTSCDNNDEPVVSPILSFYVELVDADGNPIITNEAEAKEFLLVRAIPMEPKENLNNFAVWPTRPEKGEDGRYYLRLVNNCASANNYTFTLDSHAFKAPYSFEMTWDSSELKQITINGEKPAVGTVPSSQKEYYTVALKVNLR